MDLSQYNRRKKSEEGVFVGLCHEFTGEPFMDGEKQPGFMVRGIAAKSVQSRLAEMQREAKKIEAAAAEQIDGGEDMDAVLERLHQSQVDSAMGYIICGVDMEFEDDKGNIVPVGTNEKAICSVLNFTFPEMRVVKGETVEITDDEGKTRKVPKFEIVNKTFAGQVIEAAEDGQRFFGKTAKG